MPAYKVMSPPPVPPSVTDRSSGRPVVRETAREVALVATAGRLDAPSADLVRLLAHLRATVVRHVGERRDAGVRVERALSEVKGLVREASALEGWCDPTDTLMAQVVRWTIAAYFDEARPARV